MGRFLVSGLCGKWRVVATAEGEGQDSLPSFLAVTRSPCQSAYDCWKLEARRKEPIRKLQSISRVANIY